MDSSPAASAGGARNARTMEATCAGYGCADGRWAERSMTIFVVAPGNQVRAADEPGIPMAAAPPRRCREMIKAKEDAKEAGR